MVVLRCFMVDRRSKEEEDGERKEEERVRVGSWRRPRRRRMGPRPERVPETWGGAVALAAATVRFAWAETVGKWGIPALAFGIKSHMQRHQDRQQFARVYAGNNCVELKGPEIEAKFNYLLRLLNICMLFTKKSFPLFLEFSGYSREDVILEEHKAGLLKPNFTVICDRSSRCFLLFIRGALSIKDKLTAATGEMVPFHHLIIHEGQVDNMVLGYAHCGMLAAARWIAKRTTPHLLKAVRQNSDFKIKIIGHSMGAGIAAILTYILREHEEFSSSTCIAFGPAACMTWDLAESSKHFITSIVNCTDLVPTFSPGTVNDLRSEVRAASRANDPQESVQCTRFCNVVYQSASTLGCCRQYVCTAKATGAGTTEGVAHTIARRSCMGVHRHATSKKISDSIVMERDRKETEVDKVDFCCSTASDHKHAGEENNLMLVDHAASFSVREITGDESWLEKVCQYGEKEEATEVMELAEVLEEAGKNKQHTLSDALERFEFYPPGRMMHMIVMPASNTNSNEDDMGNGDVRIFETPRELYGKIKLAKTMISDHYMDRYIETMEQLVNRLRNDDGASSSSTSSSSAFSRKLGIDQEPKTVRPHETIEQNCVISCQADANSIT